MRTSFESRLLRTALPLGLAVVFINAQSSCVKPDPVIPVDCASGTHEDPATHQCVSNAGSQATVTININPNPANADRCPNFSPNPASVKAGYNFWFKNNTGISVTIMGNGNDPWVTVAPGAYSSTLSFSSSGVRHYGTQACLILNGHDYDPYYGNLTVTVG